MYETQQAHALKRVGGTAPSNTLSQSTGKVRQMFEERRTKAGIDKSYPLQPIGHNSKVTKQPAGGGSVITTTSKTTTRNGYHTKVDTFRSSNHQDNGGYTRQKVTMEVRQKSNSNDLPTLSKTHRFESDRILRDQNLNEEFLDDVTLPDGFEQISLESVTAKLPNVGGALPSQRQAAKLKENNNNVVTKSKPLENVKTNGESRVKVSPITKKPSVKPFKSNSPASSVASNTQRTSSNISPIAQSPTPPAKAKTPVEKVQEIPKTPVKKAVPSHPPAMSGSPKSKPSTPPDSPPKTGPGVECKICKRRFDPDRLAKHQAICAKTGAKKRKPYDPVKHRIEGTGVEAFVKVQRKGNKVLAVPKSSSVKLKPNNWRQKHEDFIRAIRAAKEMQAHVNQGGKLSDLPPPPPSENPDYVQCPHCGRRFNQSAAERHIPKCANFQFNKPKPGQSKKR